MSDESLIWFNSDELPVIQRGFRLNMFSTPVINAVEALGIGFGIVGTAIIGGVITDSILGGIGRDLKHVFSKEKNDDDKK